MKYSKKHRSKVLHLKKNPCPKFLVAQNCIKKDLEIHFFRYRDFEVNFLVLS